MRACKENNPSSYQFPAWRINTLRLPPIQCGAMLRGSVARGQTTSVVTRAREIRGERAIQLGNRAIGPAHDIEPTSERETSRPGADGLCDRATDRGPRGGRRSPGTCAGNAIARHTGAATFFFSPETAIQSENWPGLSRSILTQSADERIGLATRDHRGTLRDRGDRYWEPTLTPMKNQRSAPEMENEQELAHSL
jgi:hypothetical protein